MNQQAPKGISLARNTAFPSLVAPKGNRRLIVPYLLAGVIVTVLLAIVGVVVSRSSADSEALRNKARITEVVASSVIEPLLTEPKFDAQQIDRIDGVVHRGVLDTEVVRVKMWTADGTIVYSDFREAIGHKFELDTADRNAFTRGKSSAKVTNLSDAENYSEQGFGELISVYTGVVTPKGTPLLFEMYFRHSAVEADAKQISRQFLPVGVGALVLLQLIQFPLMWILSRRLTKRDREKTELTRYALDATGAASRRIASDLHDGVVQDLVAINYSLISNASKLQAISPLITVQNIAREIEGAGVATRQAIQSLRSLIVDIYPPSLHEEGLEMALTDLLATAAARGLTTTLHVAEASEANFEQDELIYRVAQEAVRNTVQHAHAKSIQVAVERKPHMTVLTIADDGVGSNTVAMSKVQRSGHFGLNIIRDVVESANGEVVFSSLAAGGFLLTAHIPS